MNTTNPITPSRPPCECGAPEHDCHWWGDPTSTRTWLCTHCAIAAGYSPMLPHHPPSIRRFVIPKINAEHTLNWQAFDVLDDGSKDTVIVRQDTSGDVHLVATVHNGALHEDQAFAARLIKLAPRLVDDLRLVRENIMDPSARSYLSDEASAYIRNRIDELLNTLVQPINLPTTEEDSPS